MRLLSSLGLSTWAGHSERATLASGLAALGVRKADRDPIGRWSPDGSNAYVRNYRALVAPPQKKFAAAAMESDAVDLLGEEEAVICYQAKMQVRCRENQAEKITKDLLETARLTSQILNLSRLAWRPPQWRQWRGS